MLSHIFSDVVQKLHATRSHSFSTCVLLTMKPFQNTFLWSLMPEETNKGPTLTSSVSQAIVLKLVIFVLSSVIQERLCLPHAGHSLFQSAPGDPADPSNPSGGDLGKVYLEKGKILLGREGWGEMWKKQVLMTRSIRKKREGLLQVLDHKGSPTLTADHKWCRFFSWNPWKSTEDQLSKEQAMADTLQEQVLAHLKEVAACGDPPQDQAPGGNWGCGEECTQGVFW